MAISPISQQVVLPFTDQVVEKLQVILARKKLNKSLA